MNENIIFQCFYTQRLELHPFLVMLLRAQSNVFCLPAHPALSITFLRWWFPHTSNLSTERIKLIYTRSVFTDPSLMVRLGETNIFFRPTFFFAECFFRPNFFFVQINFSPIFFSPQKWFHPQKNVTQNFCLSNLIRPTFLPYNFFFDQIFFRTTFYFHPHEDE